MVEIERNTIGEAHSEVVRLIIEEGIEQTIETEPGKFMKTWEYPDPVAIVIRNPNGFPRMSPGSLHGEKFVDQYRKNLLTITCNDPIEWRKRQNGVGFTYTYADRLMDAPVWDDHGVMHGNGDGFGIDQIAAIVAELSRSPNSRRGNAVTWCPRLDIGSVEPPCLQVAHFMLRDGLKHLNQNPNEKYLSGRFILRSNDMMSAYGSNANGFCGLMMYVAGALSKALGSIVDIGCLYTYSSSAHIYCESQSDDLRSFKKYLRVA